MKAKIGILIIVLALAVVVAIPTAVIVPDLVGEQGFKIAVMSDTHVLSEEQMGTEVNKALLEQEAKGQKMLTLSEGIFKEGIDLVIAKRQDVLLISGDLTDDGARKSHEAVARELARAEASGVACYVINGNHDINNSAHNYATETPTAEANVTAEEFAEIYADFGYDEAMNRHADSLSYTAKLNDEYMLLAIDCNFYEINRDDGYVDGRHDSVTTDSLIAWIESSLKSAKESGYRVLAMSHFPLAKHLTDLIDNTSTTADRRNEICNLLFEYSVEYIFTGHLHSQDIALLENEDGTKHIYDIETGSLCNYPMPIRFFNGKEQEETVKTKYLTSLRAKYVPSLLSADVRESILSDFTAYAESFVDKSMKTKVMNKLDEKMMLTILGALGADKTATDTRALANDMRTNMILDFFDTPIYADGSGRSVEEICEKYGVELPKSDYDTVWSVAMEFLRANYRGNECYKQTDVEGVLLRYALYTAFYKIDEFDLFAKIHKVSPSVQPIDLTPSMEKLFTEGKLDVAENNLLGILGSIKVIKRFQERWSKKAVIGGIVESIDFSDAKSILSAADEVLTLVVSLNLKLGVFLEGNAVATIIDGLPVDKVINCKEGYVDIAVVYDLLFGNLGTNLITDRAPDDESIECEKIA